jgi:chorismate mutase
VTLSLNTGNMEIEMDDMLSELRKLEFVEKVEVLGTGA